LIKYSIIIPHYNSEITLAALLESIPKREDIEVLVIDDRSTTSDFIGVVEGSHLCNKKSHVNDSLKGAGSCRNIGLENASGEYFIFADSDDYFTSNAFDQIDAELGFIDREVDILFFCVTSINSENGLGFRHIGINTLVTNFIKKSGCYYEEKLRLTHNVPWGKVFRAEFIEKNNITFDQTIVANDGMFSVKSGKAAENIYCSDKTIYCATQTDGSLTVVKNINNYRVRLEIYVRYYNFLTKEERKKIQTSPLPLLYTGLGYGLIEIFKSAAYLKRNEISIFNNFRLSRDRLEKFLVHLRK